MIKHTLSGMIFAPLLLLASTSLTAQNLTLFESVAGDVPVERPEGLQGREEQRNLASSPAFTLVGTSRIGGKQRATLVSSSGEIVKVDSTPGSAPEIPNHSGYRVMEIGPRSVIIAGPAGTPCVAAQDKGVSCSATGLSQLTLATAAPVPPGNAVVANNNADPAAFQDAAGNIPGDNPFAAALRAAAAAEANGNAANGQPQGAFAGERFQPRRIGPDEIPPGMRVVRTPFGDRLVEL
ncbi:MAG: hypothetical protein Q8L60_10965 [Gammaproteobacteria bacterium]|nr:hypothetical protein [Gammaproteobacteria bacterium]MDP2139747.1 hypothetical protein [Gammaproteobacteria bacterium]MDP2348950.1 hypothetical protein [Gammaproteobacteria bacterium]